MIDVHAHVLPGVDDGAESLEESMQMLQMAYQQGFRTVIATPHYYGGGRSCKAEVIVSVMDQVKQEVKKQIPDMLLFLGQEIRYFDGILESLKSGEVFTMAGSRYVLVEFGYGDSWNTIYQGSRKLLNARYFPIIAHVERYQILREKGKLSELLQMGAKTQMNYKSLDGGLFDREAHWCREQVSAGRIHLLGTDAHNTTTRKPDTDAAVKWLKKKCSENLVKELTKTNIEQFLADNIKRTADIEQ